MNNKEIRPAYYLGGCSSIIISTIFILLFVYPENKILGYLALFFTAQNIIYTIVGLIIVSYLFWIYFVPTTIRKLIVTVSLLGISIVALYWMNSYFNWGWNFPDVFGIVGGTAGLSFALLDRYIGSR